MLLHADPSPKIEIGNNMNDLFLVMIRYKKSGDRENMSLCNCGIMIKIVDRRMTKSILVCFSG